MIRLRPFQSAGLEVLLGAGPSVRSLAALLCTGAGKTLLGLSYAGATFGRQYERVVFTSPMRHILDGFLRSGESVHDPRLGTIPIPGIVSPNTDQLISYLTVQGPKGQAAACCHAMLASEEVRAELRQAAKSCPGFAAGLLVVSDECHHEQAECLGESLRILVENGAVKLSMSATPDASAGEDAVTVYRTLSQHMAEGMAPARIKSEIVSVDCEPEGEDSESFLAPSVVAAARRMAEAWRDDGFPKTTIWLKAIGDRETNQRAVAEVIDQLCRVRPGARERILDATGTDDASKNRFLQAMEGEARAASSGSFEDSKYDVIVGIRRVIEGMDWPFCSHGYALGIPWSYTALKQFIGRETRFRKHIQGYPEQWVDQSKIVLFTCGMKDASPAHMTQTAFVAATLASYDLMTQWSVFKELAALCKSFPAAERQAVERPPVDERIMHEVRTYLWRAKKYLTHGGPTDRHITLKEIVRTVRQFIEAGRPLASDSPPREVLLENAPQAVAAILLEASGEAERNKLHEYAAASLASGASLDASLKSALTQVIREFGNSSMEYRDDVRQVLGFDSEHMERCAEQVIAALPALTDDDLVQAANAFADLYGLAPVPGRCRGYVKGRIRKVEDAVPGRNDTFTGLHKAALTEMRKLRRRKHGLWGVLLEDHCRKHGTDWLDGMRDVHDAFTNRNRYATEAFRIDRDSIEDSDCRLKLAALRGAAGDGPRLKRCLHYAYFHQAMVAASVLGIAMARELGVDLCLRLGGLTKTKVRAIARKVGGLVGPDARRVVEDELAKVHGPDQPVL